MIVINSKTREMVRVASIALGDTSPKSGIVERFEIAYNCKVTHHTELPIATHIEFNTPEDELLFLLKFR